MAITKKQTAPAKHQTVNDEVIYHIFQRSFYDSNGDKHGDLEGIRQKLDYLQELGVTAIMLTPLYKSPFYHNYFADDFKKIDPRYGTLQNYLQLVRELHQRGMKLYLDMETQYVTEDHVWWTSGINNPGSKYKDYILYDDPAHTQPSSIIYGLKGLEGYDGTYRQITTVNLNNPAVLEYNYQLFKYWMDPKGDGSFDEGVDGFRLDHMMDNLDDKPALPNLFDTFWNPLLGRLRRVNPAICIIAEQANCTSYGEEYLDRAGADRVFGFELCKAIRSFDKANIINAAEATLRLVRDGKQQVIFIENHDMPRFSSGVAGNWARLKIGAALNLLLGGVPAIYYGQELGMSGMTAQLGDTDANDIPSREAFAWHENEGAEGLATWYLQTGTWKDQFTKEQSVEGIALEQQRFDPGSLWNFYRDLIGLRKQHRALINGAFKNLDNDNDSVFSFERFNGTTKLIVVINLSEQNQNVSIQLGGMGKKLKSLFGIATPAISENTIKTEISPFAIEVWKIR